MLEFCCVLEVEGVAGVVWLGCAVFAYVLVVVVGVFGAFCRSCCLRFSGHLNDIAVCDPLQFEHLSSVAWQCL